MHLSVHIQSSLKNTGNRLGFRGDSVTLGRDASLPFADMICKLLTYILDRYCIFTDAETLNAELDKLRERLVTLKVAEVVEEEIDET